LGIFFGLQVDEMEIQVGAKSWNEPGMVNAGGSGAYTKTQGLARVRNTLSLYQNFGP